jgi:two-component system KDP operon response regulator KdpE
MAGHILIVEDDRSMARVLQINLQQAGYDVTLAHTGEAGLDAFQQTETDLVMLDVVLPDRDGLTICAALRQQSNVPILMMSATAITEEDIATGLDAGADEYMLKPLGDIELAARINALLRRVRMERPADMPIMSYDDGYLNVDVTRRRVMINGKEVHLTPTEFNLLALFIQNDGDVLPFATILEQVWGKEYESEHHYPRIYVSHLRRKIEPNYSQPVYIHNEYGVGYRFTRRT